MVYQKCAGSAEVCEDMKNWRAGRDPIERRRKWRERRVSRVALRRGQRGAFPLSGACGGEKMRR